MRFLHTADWHVGKTLRGRSRIFEQEQVLAEILRIAFESRIDCVLICGDLYDSHAPSPDAERLVFQFFSELIGRRIPAVVIGGNHDHPKRLSAFGRLVEQFQVFVRPEPRRPEEGGRIEFRKDGETALIATLPFVSERKIIDAVQLMEPEERHYAEYQDRVAGMIGKLTEGFSPKTINLLLAHLFVSGAQTSGSERAIHVSKPYEVSGQRLPASAGYIALGHLHRPQEVAAPSKTRYAGSPLQLDFGEQLQDKQVVLVDARAGKPADVETVRLSAGRRLRDVSGTLESLLKPDPEWGEDYLRVTVRVPAPTPGIADQIREILPNAVDIRIDYPRAEAAQAPKKLGALTPEAMFAEFYLRQRETEPAPEVAALFRELYQEVAHETDPA